MRASRQHTVWKFDVSCRFCSANKMTYAITGIPLPDDIPQGEVPLRQDVNALFSAQDELSKKQVKLMLLAMHEFEQTDVTKMLSYFQIAGLCSAPLTSRSHEGFSRADHVHRHPWTP